MEEYFFQLSRDILIIRGSQWVMSNPTSSVKKYLSITGTRLQPSFPITYFNHMIDKKKFSTNPFMLSRINNARAKIQSKKPNFCYMNTKAFI